MIAAPISQNEAARLEALRRYDILDTLCSKEFDDFTRLATEICEVPIGLISLVDADRQWFKSKVGLDALQTPRDISLCGHAIQGTKLFEIPNALEDERFFDNPLVTGAPDIRFYAGMPLITSDGYGIGTLCVIDRVQRKLNSTQRDSLNVLGRLLVQQLELHLTVRKEQILNAELERQSAFRKALLDSAGLAIISSDINGVITSFNPGAEILSGYGAEEIIGKASMNNFQDKMASAVVLNESGHKSDSLVPKAQSEATKTDEWVYIRKDGTQFPVERTTSAIRDSNNTLIGFLEIALNITDRKLIENTKAEFISVVSHELRTPLTSIRGSLGLIENGVFGELPAKVAELIKVASRNSQRLITLVNDILDMDKLISGKMIFRSDQINIATLIEQSMETNAAYAAALQVRYVLTKYPSKAEVIGDPDRVMQVMANLLSNAAKFSPVSGQVEISCITDGAFIRVDVKDHGNGIPMEFQDKIFGKFSQADNGNSERQGGTGLGLNICQKLLEKMNGEIGFHTAGGQGTTFWFRLPIAVSVNDVNQSRLEHLQK